MTADIILNKNAIFVRRESESRATKRLVIVAAKHCPAIRAELEHTLPAALSAPAAVKFV